MNRPRLHFVGSLGSLGSLMTVALLAVAPSASAQGTKPSAPVDTRETNLRAYSELLRSDVRFQKVAIITEIMQFTEDEDAKFWPIYREYEAALAKINDDRLALIKEYCGRLREHHQRGRRPAGPRGARSRSSAPCTQSAVLRSFQIRPFSEDRSPVSPSGKPDPADHRLADRGIVTRRAVARQFEVTPCEDLSSDSQACS